MKLLPGHFEAIEKDGIKLEIRTIDTATQSAISDLSAIRSLEGRIRLIGFILTNVVTKVSIEGESYDPKVLAEKADISDPDTLTAMLMIGGLVVTQLFPKVDDLKK